ncbi:hypothetical protein CNY89_22485, partial [Amaricoccus sp. HAR-UPW-R2A-40]
GGPPGPDGARPPRPGRSGQPLPRPAGARLRPDRGPGNPFLAWVAPLAQTVRDHRAPADPDNPFLALQARVSDRIVEGLEAYRKAVEATSEETFRRIYGAPARLS